MAAHDALWQHMMLYGSTWCFMAAHDALLQHMMLYGSTWCFIAAHNALWQHMMLYGSTWCSMAAHNALWQHIMRKIRVRLPGDPWRLIIIMLNNRRMQKLNVDMPRSGMLLFALRNLPGKDCRQSGPCPLGVICKVHAFRMGGGGAEQWKVWD
jgi:hypothetical protein